MRTHLMSHVVRRGVQHLTRRQQYPDQLLQDAQAYEDAGPEMEVQPHEMLLILITALVGILIVCSVRHPATRCSRHEMNADVPENRSTTPSDKSCRLLP